MWDYDSPYEVMLFTKDGKDLIVHMNKSGYVFVLDRTTGNIENIWPISDVKNFVKDIDKKTGELIGRVELPMDRRRLICPSTFGGRNWNSGAYNPKTDCGTTTCSTSVDTSNQSREKTIPRIMALRIVALMISADWSWHPTVASPAVSMPAIQSPASANGRMRWMCPASPAS